MDSKIQKVLEIWHEHFKDEDKQYSEFESSDIEYFVSCMLYNHFKFSKALDTMQTIDLSYDFLESCDEEYDAIKAIIESINLDSEMQKVEFLQEFINESQAKYTKDALYLLNRMAYHVDEVKERTQADIQTGKVEFIKPEKKLSTNPLLR